MTRKLLLAVLALSIAIISSAQDKVSVASGDLSVLDADKTALFKADYSQTKVGKQSLEEYLSNQGEDHVRDWPAAVDEAANYFIKDFNKKSSGLKIRESETVVAADYLISFRVLFYNPGDSKAKNVPFIVKEGGTTLSGYIDIIDRKTEKVECSILVDEVTGASYPSVAPRIGFAYMTIIKKIFELKK